MLRGHSIRRALYLLPLAVFALGLFTASLPDNAFAQSSAPTSVRRLNIGQIQYGDSVFTDSHVADNTWEFTRPACGGGSSITLSANNATGTADARIRFTNSDGRCQTNSHNNLPVTDSGNREVVGYYASNQRINLYADLFRYGCFDGANESLVKEDPGHEDYRESRYFPLNDGDLSHSCWADITRDNDGRRWASLQGAHHDFPNNLRFRILDADDPLVNEIEDVAEREPGEDGGPSCESAGNMGWIMCPVIKLIEGGLNWVDTQIQRLLQIDARFYTSNEMRGAFSAIRNLAFLILVPVVLVMVIGTALGFDFVSAYTVKRALPRLLVAIVFITLSYQICVFLIEFFNALGSGTLGLITAPFGSGTQGLTLESLFQGGIIQGLLSSIIAAPALVIVIWLFGGTLLLAAIIAFGVLLLRQLFIVVLMLAAPLAILAWIFPGNDKLWKTWWGSFSKLLIMYPLIMALIAIGRIFAFTIDSGDAAGLEGAVLQPLMTLVAYMIPYAFIPFTFKFAGGMFATFAGVANDRSKGLFDRQRKRRERILQDTGQRAQTGNLFRGAPENSLRSRLNTGVGYATNAKKAGLRPSMWKGNMQGALADQDFEHAMEESEKLPGAKAFFANDTLMRAGLEGEGDITKTRNYLASEKGGKMSGKELDIALGQVMRMRRSMGGESYALASLAKLPATGTAYEEGDIGKWHEDIAKYTHGNKSLQGSLVAAGKSGFRSAQRYEVSEAGFGDHLAAIAMAERGEDTGSITDMIVDKAYMAGGPSAVVGSRNAKVAGMFAKAINRRLDTAKGVLATPGADEESVAMAQREVLQQQAAISSIHDQSGQAKQVVGKVLADEVFGRDGQATFTVADPGTGQTVTRIVKSGKTQLQEVEGVRDKQEFREMKKEYGLSEEEAMRRGGGTQQPKPGEGIDRQNPGGGVG